MALEHRHVNAWSDTDAEAPSAPPRPACPLPAPDVEAARLQCLGELSVLDTPPDPALDGIARCAAQLVGCPIALVTLLDERRQWFKARVGLPEVSETPRAVAFCAHAILDDALFEVPDAWADARFAANPLVTGAPHIRFYAGVPVAVDGHRLGTLCVIDRQPRRLDDAQRALLRDLAAAAAQWLQARRERLDMLQWRASADDRTRYVAQLGHDLRTPLTSLVGSAQSLLLDGAALPRPQREHLMQLRDDAQTLLGLVHRVLSLGRLDAKARPPTLHAVPLAPLLAECHARVRLPAEGRALRLGPPPAAAAGIALYADPLALAQVLTNLLGNAVRYNRRGGRLWMTVERAPHHATVSVHDDGRGLSPQQLVRLFRPYDRLGAERSSQPGNGLGLVVAQRLLQAMGGDLDVESTPGVGSTFSFTLPLAK